MARYIDAETIQTRWITFDPPVTIDKIEVPDIDSAPTISPDDARGVGEWEDAKQHGLCRCSVCKDCYIEKDYITQAKWNYCPNCGVRMKGAEDGTTDVER